jgi:very-short-patch-repair endonuclease
MGTVAGWPVAFRGSTAIAAGVVSKGELRGPRFERIYPDTYVAARDEPPDLVLRSHAAYRYVEPMGGVLAGYSAAEVLGASCGPREAPAEVTVPHRGQRPVPGLLVHRTQLAPGEIWDVDGLRVTSPVRTAYDLARRGDLVERVVAVDRLANVHRFNPDLLLNFTVHYPRLRGNESVPDVLAHADRRAGSPTETRLRMLVVQAGLPRPEVQWPVQDEQARTAVWLDLAWPQHLIGVEYEGADHTRPHQVLRDAGRYTALVDKGWRIYRYTAFAIRHRADLIIEQLTRALRRSA